MQEAAAKTQRRDGWTQKTKRKAKFDNTKLEQSCCAHSQKDSMV
jgi:hypothetical protein